VRPYHAIGADIQDLLGVPLRLLAAIRRDAHHRGDGRSKACSLDQLAAVEHVLQCISEAANVVAVVFHLENDAVVFRPREIDCAVDLGGRKAGQRRLAGLERFDDAIQARNIGHVFPLAVRSCWRASRPAGTRGRNVAERVRLSRLKALEFLWFYAAASHTNRRRSP
jgi:hypothetical protein